MDSRYQTLSLPSRLSLIVWGMALSFLGVGTPGSHAYADDVTSCMGCHWDIYKEWERSLHGTAWTDPVYQESLRTADHPEQCWSCHAPVFLYSTGMEHLPIARTEGRETGVTCISCHVDADDVMHGPTGPESTGHFTEQDPLFTVGKAEALCLTCHGEPTVPEHSVRSGFANRPDTLRRLSCIDCHMPAVTRAHAEDPIGILDVPARPGRRHTFIGSHDPDMIADALTVTLQPNGRVMLRNDRAGHGIPGGITKTLIIRLYTRDDAGIVLSEQHVEIRQANQLLPGASWTGSVTVTTAVQTVGVVLQYRYADHQRESEYLHIGTFERSVP